MWVVMRERESVENFFLLFSTSFNMFFLREIKKRCVCGSGDGKELEKCRKSFPFSVITECIFIFTTCNVNVISVLIVTNNIRKELVMIVANYEYQIAANQSTKSIIINNKSEHKINPN